VPGLEAGRAEAATPPILAEATASSVPLKVQVVAARRVSPDTVRLDLVLLNQSRAANAGPEAEGGRAAMAGLVAGLADASIVSKDGRRRVFSLQAADRPVGVLPQVPDPGGRGTAWMVFVGQPGDAGPITLVLPGFPPMAGIPVI
jgi:hypothetical protein